jgi:hypothetical protein
VLPFLPRPGRVLVLAWTRRLLTIRPGTDGRGRFLLALVAGCRRPSRGLCTKDPLSRLLRRLSSRLHPLRSSRWPVTGSCTSGAPHYVRFASSLGLHGLRGNAAERCGVRELVAELEAERPGPANAPPLAADGLAGDAAAAKPPVGRGEPIGDRALEAPHLTPRGPAAHVPDRADVEVGVEDPVVAVADRGGPGGGRRCRGRAWYERQRRHESRQERPPHEASVSQSLDQDLKLQASGAAASRV